jgi:hypothetical protein
MWAHPLGPRDIKLARYSTGFGKTGLAPQKGRTTQASLFFRDQQHASNWLLIGKKQAQRDRSEGRASVDNLKIPQQAGKFFLIGGVICFPSAARFWRKRFVLARFAVKPVIGVL